MHVVLETNDLCDTDGLVATVEPTPHELTVRLLRSRGPHPVCTRQLVDSAIAVRLPEPIGSAPVPEEIAATLERPAVPDELGLESEWIEASWELDRLRQEAGTDPSVLHLNVDTSCPIDGGALAATVERVDEVLYRLRLWVTRPAEPRVCRLIRVTTPVNVRLPTGVNGVALPG